MPTAINTTRLRETLVQTIGPSPWYWNTFPAFTSPSGRRVVWRHHGDQGPLAYVVSCGEEEQPDRAYLALNSYCRPFLAPPSNLGVWCPEGRSIRVTCFDPDQLQDFDLAEVAGWFKPSAERIYAKTAPVADFEVPLALAAGTHKIEVPAELRTVDELIVPTSYPAKSEDDAAFALYVLYLSAGLVEVLPQRWFTASQYQIGKQWIPRAHRSEESHQLFGECFGVGTFLLEEEGCRLQRWIEKAP